MSKTSVTGFPLICAATQIRSSARLAKAKDSRARTAAHRDIRADEMRMRLRTAVTTTKLRLRRCSFILPAPKVSRRAGRLKHYASTENSHDGVSHVKQAANQLKRSSSSRPSPSQGEGEGQDEGGTSIIFHGRPDWNLQNHDNLSGESGILAV